MYLHEGLEPKVVHRDVKSSNILLDKNWNPKVSDFGLAKLLGSERSFITTRVMGTFGFDQLSSLICGLFWSMLLSVVKSLFVCRYVAPEYAKTGMLNEKSDVYSFGILVMEIISGRSPVDYSRPPSEVDFLIVHGWNFLLTVKVSNLFGFFSSGKPFGVAQEHGH